MEGVTRTQLWTRSDARRAAPRTRHVNPALAPTVLLIGASTGGPQALTALVSGLVEAGVTVPICVTLHMPAGLMPIIATHVARCGIETRVVTEPQRLAAGVVHFSPGDRHFDIRRGTSLTAEAHLRPGIANEICKAVDVMFTSAAASLGSRALAVVLSGMGKDGLAGARAIVAAGGSVLVQDKPSSAVWGMPGAIAKADLAAAVLPPQGLAADIARRLRSVAAP